MLNMLKGKLINEHMYLMNRKSEICERIKEYKARVETKFYKRLKIIRFDRDKDYTSKELRDFLKTQYTTTYSRFVKCSVIGQI